MDRVRTECAVHGGGPFHAFLEFYVPTTAAAQRPGLRTSRWAAVSRPARQHEYLVAEVQAGEPRQARARRDRHTHTVLVCLQVFVGDQSVGKTSIISRFMYDQFDTHYASTIGIDFVSKSVPVDNGTVRLQLCGSHRRKRRPMFGAAACASPASACARGPRLALPKRGSAVLTCGAAHGPPSATLANRA